MVRLYKGKIYGTVINEPQVTDNAMNFVVKLEENIEGIPQEIVVQRTFLNKIPFFYLRKGDKVGIEGEIFENHSKTWKKQKFGLLAKSVFNEDLQTEL